MPPHFPCKELGDFKSARQRRKHVNMLLLDGCEEYHRTYDADGWPRHPLQLPLEPHTLVATKIATATEPLAKAEAPAASLACTGVTGVTDGSGTQPGESGVQNGACANASTDARQWMAAYAEGGQEAADLAKQVGNVRSPTGGFFALTQPGCVRAPLLAGDAILASIETATEPVVLSGMQHSGFVGNATSTLEERQSRSWLMPHQTRDRAAGAKMARAIKCARTPIGAFANFDLAKAPAKA